LSSSGVLLYESPGAFIKSRGFCGGKVGKTHFLAKITITELESLTANDAGRILREDGNLAGRISVRKDGVSVRFFYRWGD